MGNGACSSCYPYCPCSPCCKPDVVSPTQDPPLSDKPELKTRLPSPEPIPTLLVTRKQKTSPKPLLGKPSVNIVDNCLVVWLDLSTDRDPAETQEIEEQLRQVSSTVKTTNYPKDCLKFINDVKHEKVFVVVTGAPDEQFISAAQNSSTVEFVYVLDSEQESNTKWSKEYPQVRDSYKTIQRLCLKLKEDIKICDHDMIGFGLATAPSVSTTTESDQDLSDGETTEEVPLNTETGDNQDTEDDETKDESSLDMPVKSISTTVNVKTKGGSSSSVATKSSGKMAVGKVTGGMPSKTPAPTSAAMTGDQTTGGSQPNITLGSHMAEVLLMYDQLFRKNVLELKEEDMISLCEFCRTHIQKNSEEYKQNDDTPEEHKKNELDFIENLKTRYSTNCPIRWYTMEACLYKILNKALRIHAYDVLYELRVFIRHLHEDIIHYQRKTPWEGKRLYRGQGFAKEEFDFICSKKGVLLRFSNFLSTSAKENKAVEFAHRARDGKRVPVLLKITVTQNCSVPFAFIQNVSVIKGEEEWLFTMGSAFRIGKTVRRPDGIYAIYLTTAEDNSKHLAEMKEYFQDSMNDKNVYLNFARLMHQLGLWKQSRELYLKSLKTENNWDRQVDINNNLGLISSELKEYEEALNYYNKAHELEKANGGSQSKGLASTYNNMGTLYYKQKEMDLAHDYFQKAIDAHNNTPNDDQEFEAALHNNIASVQNSLREHEKALQHNEICLNIRVNSLPDYHPTLAITCNSIATTYYHLGSFQNAVKYAKRAVEIDNQILPPDHPQMQIHKENLKRFSDELASSKPQA